MSPDNANQTTAKEDWHKLAFNYGPDLLFRFHLAPGDGYEFLVTDLTYVWSESLSRQQIIQRAEAYDTSIDPSEDREQFDIFVSTVREALTGAAEESSVQVAAGRGHGGGDGDALEIETSTNLPPPLRTLNWVFQLKRLPENAITEHIIIPLLTLAKDREERIASMFQTLQDKGWALGKILDRMESTSVDVASVFPGQRFPRHGSLSQKVAQTVRGAAPFVYETWDAQFHGDAASGSHCGGITKELFGDDSQKVIRPAPDFWWQKSRKSQTRSEPASRKQRTKPNAKDDEDSSTDTDFESKPPAAKPKSKSERREKPSRRNDDTRSDSDSDSGSDTQFSSSSAHEKRRAPRSNPQKRQVKPPRSSSPSSSESEDHPKTRDRRAQCKKLGTVAGLGKKNKPRRNKEPDSQDPSSEDGSATAITANRSKPQPPNSDRRGLGTIGGSHGESRKPSQQSASMTERGDSDDSGTEKGSVAPEHSSDTDSASQQESQSWKRGAGKKNLGRIGGKGKPYKRPQKPSSEADSDSETPTGDATSTKKQRQRPQAKDSAAKERTKPKLGMVGPKAKTKAKQSSSTDESTGQSDDSSDSDTKKRNKSVSPKKRAKAKIGVIGGKSPQKRTKAPMKGRQSKFSLSSTDEEAPPDGHSEQRSISPLPTGHLEEAAHEDVPVQEQESDQPRTSTTEAPAARKKPLPPVQLSAPARKKRRF